MALSVQKDLANLKLDAIHLSRNGFNVMSVSSSAIALKLAESQQFDAVFTGIILDEDMTGYDLIDKFKKQPGYQKTFFVAVTTQNDRATRLKAIDHGFDFIITKPIDREDYASVCKQIKENLALS